MLFELNCPVTLLDAYELLSNGDLLKKKWKTSQIFSKRRAGPRFTHTFLIDFSPNLPNNLAAFE